MSETPPLKRLDDHTKLLLTAYLLTSHKHTRTVGQPRNNEEQNILDHSLEDGFCIAHLEGDRILMKAVEGFTIYGEVNIWDLSKIASLKQWTLDPFAIFEKEIRDLKSIEALKIWCRRKEVIRHLKAVPSSD